MARELRIFNYPGQRAHPALDRLIDEEEAALKALGGTPPKCVRDTSLSHEQRAAALMEHRQQLHEQTLALKTGRPWPPPAPAASAPAAPAAPTLSDTARAFDQQFGPGMSSLVRDRAQQQWDSLLGFNREKASCPDMLNGCLLDDAEQAAVLNFCLRRGDCKTLPREAFPKL